MLSIPSFWDLIMIRKWHHNLKVDTFTESSESAKANLNVKENGVSVRYAIHVNLCKF